MSTLLLRLAAPLQSWGIDSKFERRTTGHTPSKSGVLGLCAAALGYRRHEDEKLAHIANLRIGVRIDKPGTLLQDFHMAHEEAFWDANDRSKINRSKSGNSYLTTRFYIADAAFLVGLEGDDTILMEIDEALRSPMYPLYLGRRSCVPDGRISLGIVSYPLKEALEKQPVITRFQGSSSTMGSKPRIVIDHVAYRDKDGNAGYRLRDFPRSFNPSHRKYGFRSVREYESPVPLITKDHDAFAAAEEASECS